MDIASRGAGLTLLSASDKFASPIHTTLWLASATLCGAVMMGLELVAFRLYAPYFGYSVYVWGSMISVVMAALTAGYALGGYFADRASASVTLCGTILASAVYQLIVLYTAAPLLRSLSSQGEFLGSGLATLLIFAPSMIALAATGPMIVRLCASARRVGSAAGRVYAISTAGGIAGILLTTFVLLPRVGTHRTLEVWCLVSFVAAAFGLWNRVRYPILILLLPIAALASPDFGWADNTIHTTESPYNLIRVVRQGTRTALLLNHQTSVHTIREEALEPGAYRPTGYYYDTFALGPTLTPAYRALVLGMAAGGSIQAMRSTGPEIIVDAVEIDPKVVDAAARYFGIDRSDPRLHIHIADARPWLLRNRDTYDIVQLDLYQGGPYIPFYLVTEEFFRLVRAHTSDRGIVMMNVFDPGANRELLASIAATMRRAFPTVTVVTGASANYMLIGFAMPHTVDEISIPRNLSIKEMMPPPDTLVFTDDRAPVEEITRRMLSP